MIAVGKAPYRISLLGGGSDLDWFVEQYERGISLGYSLDKYSYVVCNELSEESEQGILNYSSREIYKKNNEVSHPLIREALIELGQQRLVEMSSFGFASGGSGLGGSSSFLLALLASLSELNNRNYEWNSLAQLACKIEIEKLNKPIGRQDQYLCAGGGLGCYEFSKYSVKECILSNEKINMIKRLSKNFYIVPTRISRVADQVLSKLIDSTHAQMSIVAIRDVADSFIQTEETRDWVLEKKFHESVRASWDIKKDMIGVMNEQLNELELKIKAAVSTEWIRLVGAGSGGYYLFSSSQGLDEVTNRLQLEGIKIVYWAGMSNEGVQSWFV